MRLKRSDIHRLERGANAMLAFMTLTLNLPSADFLDWWANQAIAA